MLERSLRPDSGGAGRNRGGLGQVIRFTLRGAVPVKLTVRPDKMRFPAPGLLGGRPGMAGEAQLGDLALPLEPFELKPGAVVTLRLPGGGGIGDPKTRDWRALRADIDQGLVSPEAAEKVYGLAPVTAPAK